MDLSKTINALKELLKGNSRIDYNTTPFSYSYDDGAGNTYLAYASEDGIADTDAKWCIKRIYDDGLGTPSRTQMYAGGKNCLKKLNTGGGVPATLASYTYIYCR